MLQFLHIFSHSTLVVSTSTSLSSHKCYAEIYTIEKNLIKLKKSRYLELQIKAKSVR